ncbi:MAG: ion transporter [Verrucomicrobiota bacterium JB023]|nr:ion transporter [Verrucomicrobiota bacterium JB023]
MSDELERPQSRRERLWEIIFEAETPAGKFFDVALLWLIGLSVAAVMLESVDSIRAEYGTLLKTLEWAFTILFSIEYLLRLFLVRRPWRYATSFFGIVDLLSCLPTYLQLFLPGAQTLLVIRILRFLRMFRIFKMVQHMRGGDTIMRALAASRAKIIVFFLTVCFFAVIMGTLIYLVESTREDTQFTNIPVSIYYMVVTITTLGFGDITPKTPFGMGLTAVAVLTGYAIIAVPTGIVSAEMAKAAQGDETTDACPSCGVHGHLPDANFCRKCGEKMS